MPLSFIDKIITSYQKSMSGSKMIQILTILLFAVATEVVTGSPKKYEEEQSGKFEPSHRYYESNLPTNFRTQNHTHQPLSERKNFDKESKFGLLNSYPGGVPSGNGIGYGGSSVAYLNPMKIDLGGVALGAIIGIGAVLIVPKIANMLSGLHPGGYRTLDSDISVPEILSRIDNTLEQNNIDSSSCMQRVICSYVHDARKNNENGETTTIDEFILALSNNTLFSNMLDGTAIKQAIEMGKTGDPEKCSSLFPKCPVTRDSMLKVLTSLLPA